MAYTTINNPELYFQTKLYTGNDSSNAITLDGDANMQPDLIWIKNRGDGQNSFVVDSVRGASVYLETDSDDVDTSASGAFTSFNSDGFTLTGSGGRQNANSHTYVAWCWNTQGGSGTSNTSGTTNTTSTSVGQTQGFSISTYTGTGSAATIGHGLGAAPEVIIVKKRTPSDDHWFNYHKVIGNGKRLLLSNNVAEATSSSYWADTTPSSTVYSVSTNGGNNESSHTYVAYCWRSIQGFSKMGDYTGTGNVNGAFVYTGFKPAMVIIKGNNTENWHIYDNKRNVGNPTDQALQPNSPSQTEFTETNVLDFLSNGFKLGVSGSGHNGSGVQYIYMAWAEAPLVNSNGVPTTAK